MKPEKPTTRLISDGVRARSAFPKTTSIPVPQPRIQLTPDFIRHYLRQLGITENVLIHAQDLNQFLEEKGLTELGRGGEGTVYFTRGHVVKVINPACAHGSLREIAHMLHLNRIADAKGTMGDRVRLDWPTLLWVYVLSDGSLSIGMRPFDTHETETPGTTLFERLFFGPMMGRRHVFSILRGIGQSLVYAHKCGIVHHDLKPSNIYIPADDRQAPVVFDLGQALWQQTTWGRGWLRTPHNSYYWYNGTYRYMHHQRRLAHLAALAKSQHQQPTAVQAEAFAAYQPSYYDDVIAFARILRDVVKSNQAQLTPKDREAITQLYQRLMGLKSKRTAKEKEKSSVVAQDSGLIRRISLAFMRNPQPHPPHADSGPRWHTMEPVQPELESVLDGLSKS